MLFSPICSLRSFTMLYNRQIGVIESGDDVRKERPTKIRTFP
jgi:hypothetical protein